MGWRELVKEEEGGGGGVGGRYLGTLHVGLPGGHKVRLIAAFPLDEEHQLSARVRGSDDALSLRIRIPVTLLPYYSTGRA